MLRIDDILRVGHQGKASDIHLKVGLPPMFRIAGSLVSLKNASRLTPKDLEELARQVCNDRQYKLFLEEWEVDLAYFVKDVGRFRVNVYRQSSYAGMAVRVIQSKVPTLDDLNLPKVIEKISRTQRGLVLVTGTTSSGKSTTLAAMINYINSTRTCHIMTIEDPIEYMIADKRSMINQRELGMDTTSYARALKSALRQDPDVILIGELRDLETIDIAMAAAETGHMVFSTLHTMDAPETINRIISLYPPNQQDAVRLQLSGILQAVISQRLVPSKDGTKRVPAVEVMIVSNRIRELIQNPELIGELHDTMAQSFDSYGMQIFDQSLMSLVKRNYITYEEALKQASNPADFELRFSGISTSDGGGWESMQDADQEEELFGKEESDDDDFTIERF